MTLAGAALPATKRAWLGLVVLALPALLISMDLSVLYLAVPKISAALRPSAAELLWITDVYGFLLAGFLITMGSLGDRIGHRRLLMIGAAGFGAASLLAAYATSPGMLIAARAVLGVAGATLGPSTLALVGAMFPDPGQRARAIAIWATSLSVGGALGPVVGGFMLERFWWGSVFLLAVPMMVLLLVAGPMLLVEHREPAPARIDVTSVALALFSVLAVVYGLKQWGQGQGGTSWLPITAGLFACVVFGLRQGRLAEPLIDLRLFRRPVVAAALLANTAGFSIVLGITLLVTQQLQLVVGLSPLQAGLATVPMFVVFVAGALGSPYVVGSVRPAIAIAVGFCVAAGGLVLMVATDGTWSLVLGLAVLAAGLAPVFPLVTNLVLEAVPPSRTGAAAGLGETSTELGGAVGIAGLGIAATAAYRSGLDRLPAGIPDAAQAAARDSLGAAVDASRLLPGDQSRLLADAAQQAFTSGLHTAAAVGVAIALSVAVLAATVLRRVSR